MKQLNDFLTKYPDAFPAFMSPHSMYAFQMFGFECHDGWYDILEPVIMYIADYNTKHPDNTISLHQVKEKYGTLRFYVSIDNEDLDKLIQTAEEQSETSCEECGKPGMLRGRGWYYTACDEHTKDCDKK